MNAAGRLAAYGVVLGVALGGGAAVGALLGPIDVEDDDGHVTHERDAGAAAAGDLPGGVLVSRAGYTLEPEARQLDGTDGAPFRFRITGPDGEVVRRFEISHERELHLILVSADLGTFAHLHPELAADGTWSIDLPAMAAGSYRAVADFVPDGGPDLALGVDLTVAGSYQPRPLPPVDPTDVVDDYEVALAGRPAAGESNEVALTVARDGRPVDDLEPYLGASGHLVAFRAGDLAYLHVHPLADEDGATVRFAVEVPSAGAYRLFFDFAHDGEVRTAAFTLEVPADGEPQAEPDEPHHDRDGEEHS